MTELSKYQENKIKQYAPLFTKLEELTSVPKEVLMAAWGYYDNYLLSTKTAFFGLSEIKLTEDDIYDLLLQFPRINLEELEWLMGKGYKNLVCACLIYAGLLQRITKENKEYYITYNLPENSIINCIPDFLQPYYQQVKRVLQ